MILWTLSSDIHTEVKRFAETSMLTQHWIMWWRERDMAT